jgi:hypothetical protein
MLHAKSLPESKDFGKNDVGDAIVRDIDQYERNCCDDCVYMSDTGPMKRDLLGIGNLYRQRISKRSSRKPRKVAIRKVRREAR